MGSAVFWHIDGWIDVCLLWCVIHPCVDAPRLHAICFVGRVPSLRYCYHFRKEGPKFVNDFRWRLRDCEVVISRGNIHCLRRSFDYFGAVLHSPHCQHVGILGLLDVHCGQRELLEFFVKLVEFVVDGMQLELARLDWFVYVSCCQFESTCGCGSFCLAIALSCQIADREE